MDSDYWLSESSTSAAAQSTKKCSSVSSFRYVVRRLAMDFDERRYLPFPKSAEEYTPSYDWRNHTGRVTISCPEKAACPYVANRKQHENRVELNGDVYILTISSTYLSTLIKSFTDKNEGDDRRIRIVLPIPAPIMEHMMHLFYKGYTILKIEEMAGFWQAAEFLEIYHGDTLGDYQYRVQTEEHLTEGSWAMDLLAETCDEFEHNSTASSSRTMKKPEHPSVTSDAAANLERQRLLYYQQKVGNKNFHVGDLHPKVCGVAATAAAASASTSAAAHFSSEPSEAEEHPEPTPSSSSSASISFENECWPSMYRNTSVIDSGTCQLSPSLSEIFRVNAAAREDSARVERKRANERRILENERKVNSMLRKKRKSQR